MDTDGSSALAATGADGGLDRELLLASTLVAGALAALLFLGDILAPAIVALALAYAMDGLAQLLRRCGLPERATGPIVITLLVLALGGVGIIAVPLLWQQAAQLLAALPGLLLRAEGLILSLAQDWPDLLSPDQVQTLLANLRQDILRNAQGVLSLTLTSARILLALATYLLLVPLLAAFLVKDRVLILGWLRRQTRFTPRVTNIASDLVRRLGGYVRGKVYEILIVTGVAVPAFWLYGLDWALLLGTITGVSALVPIIGALLAAAPVALVAYAQWGWSMDVVWALGLYTLIQVLDGNVLQPLLFANTVGLHPAALIVAFLVFGGLWGIWGLVLAVPAATALHVLLDHRRPPIPTG